MILGAGGWAGAALIACLHLRRGARLSLYLDLDLIYVGDSPPSLSLACPSSDLCVLGLAASVDVGRCWYGGMQRGRSAFWCISRERSGASAGVAPPSALRALGGGSTLARNPLFEFTTDRRRLLPCARTNADRDPPHPPRRPLCERPGPHAASAPPGFSCERPVPYGAGAREGGQGVSFCKGR